MRYKAVLFDLDNTLMNYDASENKAMKAAVEEFGLTGHYKFSWAGYWDVFRRINTYYWENRAKLELDTGQMLQLSFGDTLRELGMDGALAAPLAELYWRLFCRTCEFEEGAPELLAELHGKARLAIVSNGIGEAQRSRLEAGGIDRYFDAVIACDEVGVAKPDAAIFQLALEQLGVGPEDALYVGDSLYFDFGGARNAGMDFCYYCAGEAGDEAAAEAARAAMVGGGGISGGAAGGIAGGISGGAAETARTAMVGDGGTSGARDFTRTVGAVGGALEAARAAVGDGGTSGVAGGVQVDSIVQPKYTVRHLREIREWLGV